MDFGRLEYRLDSHSGGRQKSLRLTLIGQGDNDTLLSEGLAALRRRRLLRITREAAQQGLMLGYEDLSALLVTSVSTLKRDIAHLERRGELVPLKGRRASMRQPRTMTQENELVRHA